MPQVESANLSELSTDDYLAARRTGDKPQEKAEEPSTEEQSSVASNEEAETVPESEPGEEQESASAEGSEEKPKEKAKGGFQKRIEKLLQRQTALEAELEEAKQKLSGKATGAEEPKKLTGKPNFDTWEGTMDEFINASVKWELEQSQAKEAQQAEAERQKHVFDTYNKNVAKAMAEHEDFREVVGNPDIQIPKTAQLAIIEADNGPEVAYYLGKNPEICEKLMDMSDVQAVMMIGRISDSLQGDEPEAKPEQKASPKPKPASALPEPIKPVSGSARQSIPLSDVDDPDEYARRRRQQKAAAARR